MAVLHRMFRQPVGLEPDWTFTENTYHRPATPGRPCSRRAWRLLARRSTAAVRAAESGRRWRMWCRAVVSAAHGACWAMLLPPAQERQRAWRRPRRSPERTETAHSESAPPRKISIIMCPVSLSRSLVGSSQTISSGRVPAHEHRHTLLLAATELRLRRAPSPTASRTSLARASPCLRDTPQIATRSLPNTILFERAVFAEMVMVIVA
jgi:hypothetical protein